MITFNTFNRTDQSLVILVLLFVCLISPISSALGQRMPEVLAPNKPVQVSLPPGGDRSYLLELSANQVIEISWTGKSDLQLTFNLFAPNAKDLLKNLPDAAENLPETPNSIPLIVPESGTYRLHVALEKDESIKEAQTITLQYNNKYRLPQNASIKAERKINGYNVKILQTPDEKTKKAETFFVIEKGGQPRILFKASSFSTEGLYFSDDLGHAYDATDKQSASLIKATPDKTGDGTPDVMLEFYSGGAHCCYITYFFELGNSIKPVEPLSTEDSRPIAIGKNPKGGLRLKIYDMAFSYWLTSFADSPAPEVILEYKDEIWRPNLKLMRKPAPSLVQLKKTAATARQTMNNEPYTGEEAGLYGKPFWGDARFTLYGT